MPKASFNFPKGFLWGAATAAHQVEGQNTRNNWHRWEEEGHIIHGHRSGLACDWWGGRWREDFDRAAETGQNAHRLSIEWSRLQPGPDEWDEEALATYREILAGLRQREMTPMVTLHHFTDPLWIYEQGGWENDGTPEIFAQFVQKAVEGLKDLCNLWITINEPNVYTQGGYVAGEFPPGKKDLKASGVVMKNLVRGHALAYRAIHQIQREARVGVAHHFRSFWPNKPWFLLDRAAARLLDQNFNWAFPQALAKGKLQFAFQRFSIPEAVGTQDFFGVNYYTGDNTAFVPWLYKDLFIRRSYPKGAILSPSGFLAHTPHGLLETLKKVGRYNLPIIITENGVEDAEDRLRPRYLVEHLHQIWRATTATIPVKGYFHWSLVDNFEWERGWTQRFGLWGLNPDTQERIRRTSVDLYAHICKQNALMAEAVQTFAPESYDTIFPT